MSSKYEHSEKHEEQTRESNVAQPGSQTQQTGITSMGPGATGMSTGMGVQNPATGEMGQHDTRAGAAADQAWQNVKSNVPGTKEHEATRGGY